MKKIKLTREKYALVDDADFEMLNVFKWFYTKVGYAARDYGNKRIYMHRFLANTPVDMQTDHVNRDRLDNRRENLRIVTKSQNMMNGNIRSGKIHSQYRGVTRNKYSWVAQIQYNKKHINLGSFSNEESAAKAYNRMAKCLFRQYANTNII